MFIWFIWLDSLDGLYETIQIHTFNHALSMIWTRDPGVGEVEDHADETKVCDFRI
jgi:hypothetical protein